MSTSEFISEISVLEKGRANIPAVILYHKDLSGNAFQRERVWDVREVEKRQTGGQQQELNYTNKPYSDSLAKPSFSIEKHKTTELLNGTVQTKESNNAIGLDKTPHTPSQFSSVLQLHHTLAEQDQAALGPKLRECSPTAVKDTYPTTEVNKKESPQNRLDRELAQCTAEEEVTSHLENEQETSIQSQNASGSYHCAEDLTDRAQDTVILKGHREQENPYTQNTARVIHIRVTKFIVSGTQKSQGHTHPHELKSDSSAKFTSKGRPIVCKLLELKEETLFPSSQTPDSTETNLQHSQANSSPDMLTSSVMTALAPSWNARSKKQKQGVADASLNPTDQEMNRRGQEVHPPTAVFSRHAPQQPFCGDPKPKTGDVFPEMNNKENTLSMTSCRSSIDSLTGSNLFNLRNHGPVKRRVSRAFSVGLSEGKAEGKTEAAQPLTSPTDTVLRPVSPHSHDLRWSRSVSQTRQFSTVDSSPTTGSLLLSLRKMNVSSKSAGTPSPVSPTSSLNSQNKKENRMSEPLSYVTLQRNRAKSQLRSSQPNTMNKPKGGSEFSPLSPSSEERQCESLRPRMFLYPNNNFEITSSPYTTSSTDRGLSPTSPHYSKLNVTKTSPLSPTPGSMLRRQHAVEGDSLQQGTLFHTSAVRRTLSNVADTLNNNKVGDMLINENIGTGTLTHSSGIYSGVPRAYDSLFTSNLNILAHQTDANVLRSPQNVANFNSYSRSNNYGVQRSKTIDVPSLSNGSKTVCPAISPQIPSPVSPRGEYALCQSANLSSPLLLKNTTNKTSLVQQSSLNTPKSLFIRDTSITETPLYSPNKNHSPLDRAASFPSWQRKVEDSSPNRLQSPLTQGPVERPDSLSLSRPRGICAPTTFSSLRHSPASPTSPAPNSSLLLSQRRENPFQEQEQNDNLKQGFESSSRHPSSPEQNENLRKVCDSSSRHLSSPASQFTFDLNANERQRSLSKTDSPVISVPLRSSHSSEKKEKSPLGPSPYKSLLSSWQTSSSASPSTISQRQGRSASFDSTLNRSETLEVGSTAVSAVHSPFFLPKLSEQKPNAVNQWPMQVIPRHRMSLPLETEGHVHQVPSTTQSVSTTLKYTSHAKDIENVSPSQPLSSPQQTGTQTCKQHEKTTVLKNDSVDQASPIRAERNSHQLNPSMRITQKECKQDSKDVTDSQEQKWSLFLSRTQRDSNSRGKENKPLQSLEKTKKNSVGNRLDWMLDHLKQSFSGKHKDEAVLKTEDTCLPHRSSSSGSLKESQERLESGPALREAPFTSVSKNIISPGPVPDQVTTKPPKSNKGDEPQVPQVVVGEYKTKRQQSHRASYVNQYATLPANWRTSKGSSNLSSLMDFYAVDAESERIFSSTSQPRRNTTSLSESKNDCSSSKALDQEGLLPNVGQMSSQSDIKYGLNQKRSFSVSSVQSSRPSGPGRISRSSSRTSSVSDLTTLEDLVSLESIVSPDDQHSGKPPTFQIGQSNTSPDRIWSPVSLERTSFPWEKESDPTPPPSPTFSPSSRRLSQGPSSSSPGSRASQDNLSPRGHLPSKSYTCNLSVFEESSSDSSTTDDEYYLDGDGDETEL
ncbi:hypothetical protein ACEWY4_019198 [Coilia grayii]|uniref:Uncharacterized protein n=1 Tax=Coilia grayii TaxID=363190 RepID=A0ABD1JIP7_9TELE